MSGLARARRDRILGLSFVLCVALIWVAGSFIVKDIENQLPAAVVTYVANALLVVLLPAAKFREWMKARRRRCDEKHTFVEEERDALVDERSSVEEWRDANAPPIKRMTESQVIVTAVMIAPLWWLAQFTFNQSLHHTSVTSNTIISSSSTLFTYLLSLWFLREPFVAHKLGGVFVCVLGTALVAISDKDSGGSEGTHKLWGDILAVVAAMIYSVYTIMLRKRLPDDDHVDMALFLGYLGLILTFTIGAILWLLIVADAVKVVGWPKGALGWAVVKGLLDNVLSDYLWARAVVLIGPTPATAGLLMQWPISIVADLLLGNANWLRQVWTAVCMLAGAMSVLVGFVGLNVEEITVREWLRGRFTRRVWCG